MNPTVSLVLGPETEEPASSPEDNAGSEIILATATEGQVMSKPKVVQDKIFTEEASKETQESPTTGNTGGTVASSVPSAIRELFPPVLVVSRFPLVVPALLRVTAGRTGGVRLHPLESSSTPSNRVEPSESNQAHGTTLAPCVSEAGFNNLNSERTVPVFSSYIVLGWHP